MFKKHLISLALLWSILFLSGFWFLYSSSSKAAQAYQELMNYSDQVKKERGQEKLHTTQQMRYQVSKQIVYKKEQQRMESRFTSESSDLAYSKREGELVEHFKHLTCMMQEKLIIASNREAEANVPAIEQPQQVIRQFKADEAIYSYKSGQLEAEAVEVVHYLISSHLWPQTLENFHPFFQGSADSIQLLLFKESSLKAQGFQAIFQMEGDEW